MAFRIKTTFQFGDLHERRVLTVLQLRRDKAVFWIGGVVLAAGPACLVSRLFQGKVESLVLLVPLFFRRAFPNLHSLGGYLSYIAVLRFASIVLKWFVGIRSISHDDAAKSIPS